MKWTEREDEVLREMYATHTRGQIADALGRTEGMVRSRCWTLDLASKVTPWSDAELSALVECYASPPPIPLDALAVRLGRDKANVCRKARAIGLTSRTRKRVVRRKDAPKYDTKAELFAAMSAKAKRQIAENGHPRGALGMKHTAETRAALSVTSKRAWADPNSGLNSAACRQQRSDLMVSRIVAGTMRSAYSRGSMGRRPDLENRYFRSSWEANYARYLNWRVARGELSGWEYEIRTFVFEKIKRGTRAYTPDFLLLFPDGRHEWHEVKGWMDPKSATRIKRMAKYFPKEVLRVIDKEWFRWATKGGLAAMLPNWERGGKRAA